MTVATQDDVDHALLTTSRTFYLPIRQLPPVLHEAVASSYLCLRAIDEIEDHPSLSAETKVQLLRAIDRVLQTDSAGEGIGVVLRPHGDTLPEVTMRLAAWVGYAPADIRARVMETTSVMAARMADWAECNWHMADEECFERYTFAMAGSVGLLLCDLWDWHDNVSTNRTAGVDYGRMLQAVNIRKDLVMDAQRGMTFLPDTWTVTDLDAYIERKAVAADRYVTALPAGPIRVFSMIPFELARATAASFKNGRGKISREEVATIMERCTR